MFFGFGFGFWESMVLTTNTFIAQFLVDVGELVHGINESVIFFYA